MREGKRERGGGGIYKDFKKSFQKVQFDGLELLQLIEKIICRNI